MVSFSCEGCGDVLTKKKLDAHRSQCRGAEFTCLDCMTHFRGTDYKTHTSCVSEEQKYQGNLYKQKPLKKSVKILTEPQAPRHASVEDGSDSEPVKSISIVEAPPEAPDPPPAAAPPSNVNVFDFLVTEDTPNASKVSIAPVNTKSMDYTPSIIGSDVGRKQIITETDPKYKTHGYSYGKDPIPSTHRKERPKVEYITPAPKDLHSEIMRYENDDILPTKSTDKKRKRLQVEELDLTAVRRPSQEPDDTIMSDAPAPVLHSGLTGGLNRLLSKSKFPPSPDYSNDPPSPVKRNKQTLPSQDLVIKNHHRERSKHSPSSAGPVVKVQKRRTSDESRPRKKKHRTHHHHEDFHHHRERSAGQKVIGYPSQSNDDSQQQMILFKSRAELFMSFITKGEESKTGMSVHKALKRYHRRRGRIGDREEEEKELWKGLRLKKNDKGEVVVFF